MKKFIKKYGITMFLILTVAALLVSVAVVAVSAKINSGDVSFRRTNINLAVGSSETLTAIGGETVSYSSDNEKVATVNAKGKVTGVAKGTATVTAKSGQSSTTVEINVTDTAVTADRYALELYVGEEDTLKAKVTGVQAEAVWTTSDEKIVTVDGGHVKGIAVGKATVTVTAGDGIYEIPIYVVDKEYSFDDNIMISIFWPPTQGYINDEQYKYMADAGITWVMGSGDNLGDEEVQKKMLELCYKYGIHMTVGDSRLGGNLTNMNAKQIKKVIDEYRNVPGANGYYMLDEPFNPNVFIKSYKALKELDPNSYMHLNFLPYASYGDVEIYKSQMNDWLKLCAETGYPQDYLMYDLYPFGLAEGSMNREGFLTNLEAVREIGLKNNVKTGTYIQSVTQSVAFRSPNEAETRYEINMALAFGVKQLSYFTWFTPFERSEPFENGIISETGVPNEKYEFICRLDKYVLTVGKTLINCDALEVYESKSASGGVSKIPTDFFAQPTSKTEDYTISYLRDKTTGRNYCMIVNNNFQKEKTFNVKFADAIKDLWVLSEDTGTLMPITMDNQVLSVDLDAGAAIILALPEDYDYSAGREYKPADGDNLALHAEVYCDSSLGSNQCYMDNLNDGARFDGQSGNGWCSDTTEGKASIILDFGQTVEFNRVDLYPCGSSLDYGTGMPASFRIRYSPDGEHWKTAAAAEDFVLQGESVPSIKFDTVSARYMQVEITKFNGNSASLNEIEVYNDKGNVPEPAFISDSAVSIERGKEKVASYSEGKNLAKGKSVQVSTYPSGADYKGWGWWPDYVCDGNDQTGWTSNVKIHMDSPNADEYCIIDLTDVFDISEIVVKPLGCWPVDFEIKFSVDGKNWTVAASETNSKKETYTADFIGNNPARYVMFAASKLTGSATDGYMLQLGEIEVYGKPYTDIEEANAWMQKFVDAGGSKNSENYKAVAAITDKNSMTQNAADKLLVAMLDEVGIKLEYADSVKERANYTFRYGPFADDDVFEEVTTAAEEETTVPEEATTQAEESTSEDIIATTVQENATTDSEVTTTSEAKSKGCGSMYAASAVIAVSAAGVVLKKKRKKN